MWRRLACLLLICWCGWASAQTVETLTLRHRTAEQIIPELKPMLAPGAALSGRGELLLVRSTPANLEEIRRLLAVLDRPVRRLLIGVRQSGQQTNELGGIAVGGELGSGTTRIVTSNSHPGAGGRVTIRQGGNLLQGQIVETHTTRRATLGQQVQTVDGGRAFINVGYSFPLAMRQIVPTPHGPRISDTVVYRDIGSGFYALPRLAGDTVSIEIAAAHDTPGQIYGSAEVQRIVATVTGRLGEWIQLGGSQRQAEFDRTGLASSASSGSSDERQIWLRVEALD